MPDEDRWPKSCRCGASWSESAWKALHLVGYTDSGEEGDLELRNCRCGSTLAVPAVGGRLPIAGC